MKKEAGYTVVETGLAIAISAAMILLTVGLVAMVGRQRFRDSLSTTQSFIQAQYNEVRSGINSRIGHESAVADAIGCNGGPTATSANCYTIGRLITFGAFDDKSSHSTIKSSYIVAKVGISGWPNPDKSSLDNLKDARLYALTGNNNDAGLNPTNKQLGNGSVINAVWYIDGDSAHHVNNEKTRNIVILRSPVDGSLVVASLAEVNNYGDRNDIKTINIKNAKINMTADQKVAIGIVNGSMGFRGGLVCIPGGDSSAGITNNFNVNINWKNPTDNSSQVVEGCKNRDID